jgi:hypothetical protein
VDYLSAETSSSESFDLTIVMRKLFRIDLNIIIYLSSLESYLGLDIR